MVYDLCTALIFPLRADGTRFVMAGINVSGIGAARVSMDGCRIDHGHPEGFVWDGEDHMRENAIVVMDTKPDSFL
jgi:hypothetical protein